MIELSNSLADLAERIKGVNEAAQAAQRQTIEKAFEAGFLLCQAKEQCAHGEWTPFLERTGIHDRQARRLMQIASCGLGIGHVSEIGGIRAALDYIGKLALPAAGDLLLVNRKEPVDGDLTSAWVEYSKEFPDHFDITSIRADGSCVKTSKPTKGKTIRCPDGYFNGVWVTLEMVLDIPHEDREFTMIPAEVLDRTNDCPFLAETPMPEPGTFPNTASAPLPLSYLKASESISRCEESLTEENVRAMQRDVGVCLHHSSRWPDDVRMLGTWARIAADKFSDRIGRIEALAKIRWGSLPA